MPQTSGIRISTNGSGDVNINGSGDQTTAALPGSPRIVRGPGVSSGSAVQPTSPSLSNFNPDYSNIPLSNDGPFVLATQDNRFKKSRVLQNTDTIAVTDNGIDNKIALNVKPDSTTQRIEIAVNDTLVGTKKRLNFKPGANTTVNAINTTTGVDVTINATQGPLASRTIQNGTGITVTNGDGVAGDPIIAINPTQLPGTDIKQNNILAGSTKTVNFKDGVNTIVHAVPNGNKIDVSMDVNISTVPIPLTALSDVNISSAQDGDLLLYDGTNWVNNPLSGTFLNVNSGGTVNGPTSFDAPVTFNDLVVFNDLDRVITVDGTISAPAHSFKNDTDSGMTLTSPGNVAIVANSIPVLNVNGITRSVQQNSGFFNTSGDNISAQYLLRTTTTSNVLTELFIDNMSQTMILSDNSTWAFDIMVLGSADNGVDNGVYRYQGAITRGVGPASIQLIGSPSETILAENISIWTVEISANQTDGSLRIRVQGETGKIIRWSAVVKTVEITN